MGNCQAAEAAAAVVQHRGGRVERLYWSTSAAEVMRANPGHYVALVTLRVAEERHDNVDGTGARRTVRLTRVKLLKPKETLLIGHVYRLITSHEVTKAVQARQEEKTRKARQQLQQLESSMSRHSKARPAAEDDVVDDDDDEASLDESLDQMAERRCWSEPQGHGLQSKGPTDLVAHTGAAVHQEEIGITKGNPRAKWSHQMKIFLITLLQEYDVPGFRTQNAWSTEAWTHIVSRFNQKFGVSFIAKQVKQKEQDMKKDYRSVKDLLAESGFGWDSERNMVDAPDDVWASFAARRNSKDALQWRDKSFPFYDDLSQLYEGRYAEGRTRQGMDHYASKAQNLPVPSSQPTQQTDLYRSQSPTMPGPFVVDEEAEAANLDSPPHMSTPLQHVQAQPRSTQTEKHDARRGKKQKCNLDDGFQEKYLKLKKEEIDRFAAIEEKKLEDPYNINKCITVLEGLDGLQLGDMLMASDIFKCKENREVFLSYSTSTLQLAWLKREIARAQTN